MESCLRAIVATLSVLIRVSCHFVDRLADPILAFAAHDDHPGVIDEDCLAVFCRVNEADSFVCISARNNLRFRF